MFQVLNDLFDKLQKVDPLVWAALAAYFAPYLQELLNRVRDFGRSSNYVIALVVVPAVIAGLTGAAHADVLANVHPFVKLVLTGTLAAVVSQLKYGLSLKPRLDQQNELNQLRKALNAGAIVEPAAAIVAPLPTESGY